MVLRRPDPDPLMDVPSVSDSALALRALTLAPGMRAGIADDELDTLVFVSAGSGLLVVGDEGSPLQAHDAGLVLAGEEAELEATGALEAVVLTAGAETDLHAPMGTRETVVLSTTRSAAGDGGALLPDPVRPPQRVDAGDALRGLRPAGQGAVALPPLRRDRLRSRGPGSPPPRRVDRGARRRLGLSPSTAAVHIVENPGDDAMTIVGLFTPAGSPSAAYLEPGVAAEYRVAG